jgi:hypothetical protein
MKHLVIISLLCASSVTFARTWQESFDEAVERKDKDMCESTYDRLNSQCDLAGIYRGGQNMNAVFACKSDAKRLLRNCKTSIDENIAEEAEKKKEEAAERDRQQMRKEEVGRALTIMRQGPPALELACTLTQTTRPQSFERNIEMKIWNGGVCSGGFGTHECSISTAQFSGWTQSRKWALNRTTGELSVESLNDSSYTAVYRCQKASPTTNIF